MSPHQATSDQIVSLPAHTPGLTRAVFSANGQLIFTAGNDTIVRIFETAAGSDVEPRLLEEHSDEINWLHCSNTHLITSCSDSSLRLFSLPANGDPSGQITFAGLLTRASGMAVRCAVFDPSGLRVACASDDLHIKILPTSLTSLRTPLILPSPPSHSKPPRSLAWSPDGHLLLSSGCDGKLCIWDTSLCILKENPTGKADEFEDEQDDVENGSSWNQPKLVKALEGVFEVGEPEEIRSTTAVWHPSGKWFVIPTKSHEILQIQRDSWAKMGKFETGGHNSSIAELCFSPNGKYLGSSGVDGKILVWEISTKKVISSYTPSKSSSSAITSLQFSPTSNILIYADASGTFGRWNDPIPSTFLHPCETVPAVEARRRARSPLFGDDELAVEEEEEEGSRRRRIGSDDELDDRPAKKRGRRRDKDDGDDTGMADEDGEEDELEEPDEDDLGFIVDEEGNEVAYGGPKWGAGGNRGRVSTKEIVSVAKSQATFQPGSTPLRGKKRYLAFNMTGAIDVIDQETHHVVNVEFHDTSRRRAFHFQDHSKFEMAALGEKGAVFASLPDSVNPISTLHYRMFDTWSSTSSEWTYDLPQSERAVAVAVGGRSSLSSESRGNETTGMVVVSTSKGYLRFFSGSGVQRYIWMLGENVVSMTAGQEEVLVVHREGGTSLDGCQNLRYTLINLESFDVIQEGRLPLPPTTTLKWIGFSDTDNPLMYDSRGIVSVLDRFRRPHQARWVPVLDTNLLARKEGKDESYWAVGVQDHKFMAVILKGRETSPYFPRPLISDLEMNLPLLNRENQQGQLEESVVRQRMEALVYRDAQIASSSSSLETDIFRLELAQDKSLLQLIQTACKADKLARALDAARLLNSVKSIDSAIQIAAFYHLPGLKEKIGHLRSIKEDELYVLEEAEQRQPGRWAHRGGRYVQPSTEFDYVTSNAGPPAIGKAAAKTVPAFAPRPVGGKRTFAGTPELTPVSVPPSSRFTLDSYPVDGSVVAASPLPMDEDEEENGEPSEGGSKKMRTANTLVDEFEAPPPERRKQSADGLKTVPKNPFAKKDANSVASNPFGRSNIGKPITVGKSTSFFDRIDDAKHGGGDGNPKGRNGIASTKESKQTTLFGLPSVPGPAKKKTGRKAEGTSMTGSEAVAAALATINGSTSDEDEPVVAGSKSKRTKRPEEITIDEGEDEEGLQVVEEGDETQVEGEETQVDPSDEEPMMIDMDEEDDEDENTGFVGLKDAPIPVNDGMSKLAAFRMKAN